MRSRYASDRAPELLLAQLSPSPVIDEELRWFFDIEDGDPSTSLSGRLLSSVNEDGEWRTLEEHAAAEKRHRLILSHVKSMPDRDAGVLQCAYSPRPWPVVLRKELRRLTGIVVRLSCNRMTWPKERAGQLRVDTENAERLHAMLQAGGIENIRALRELRRKAEVRFACALGQYVRVRRARSLSRVQ
jgi:hypothetical protein